MEPFGECWDRLSRAHSHRQAITDFWNGLDSEELYESSVEVQYNGTGVVRIYPKGVPSIIALQLGEILYQLRATLNSAVYIAAILETGKDPPPDEDKLEFPICSSHIKFNQAARKLGPLSEKRRAIVESVQPYHGSDLAKAIGTLNEWARRDRHRRLHLVGSWPVEASVELDLPPERIKSITLTKKGLLEDNPEIAEFELSGITPGTNFDIKTKVSTDIAVKDVPPGMLKGAVIHMISAVVQIVEKFDLSFKQDTPP